MAEKIEIDGGRLRLNLHQRVAQGPAGLVGLVDVVLKVYMVAGVTHRFQ